MKILFKRRLNKNIIKELFKKNSCKENGNSEIEDIDDSDTENKIKDVKCKDNDIEYDDSFNTSFNNNECKIEMGGCRTNRIYRKIQRKVFNKERKILNIVIRKMEHKYKGVKFCEIYVKINNIIKSNCIKRVVKLIIIGYVLILMINFIDSINRKVFLDMNNQEVSWIISEDLNSSDYEYELFRNGEHLVTTRACKFIESISLDKNSPNKVGNIRVSKTDNMYTFIWKDVEDEGSVLNYKVNAVNKGFGKTYSSRTLKTNVVSGIEKYIVTLDGKKYDSLVSTFSVNINSLKYGVHNLEVVAVDFAGNVSKSKSIEFKVDNTKFFIDDYKLATNNFDITSESYDVYLVKEYQVEKEGKIVKEKEEMPILIGDYIHTYFRGEEVPMISNPRYLYENELLNVTWEENTFGINNTEFYIKCKSKIGLKTYTSEKMNYTLGDFLPGYYYQVNKEPLYTVSKADCYTMDNNVSLDCKIFNRSEIYYFHIAASNEFGNLSKTKTLELDLTNFTSVGKKKDAVREILYKTKGLSGDVFRQLTDDLYNTFTYGTIKKLKEIGLKIVLAQEDIGSYVLLNHGIEVENTDICYVKDDMTLVYNTKSSLELLIKEVVKVLDEVKDNPLSENADFLKIYNQEKATLQEGDLTPVEYLAEAVNSYMKDSSLLKSTSPKTYEFVKARYKMIMFV